MPIIEVVVESDGTIVVPADSTQQLGLLPGTRLWVESAVGGGIRLIPPLEEDLYVEQDGIMVYMGVPLTSLREWVRNERDERVNALIRQASL